MPTFKKDLLTELKTEIAKQVKFVTERFESKIHDLDKKLNSLETSQSFVSSNRHDWAPDYSSVSIQNGGQMLPCGFNFADRYIAIGMSVGMSRVHSSMRTEGIKAFSKRIRRCSVDGENDTKTTSVDGTKPLCFCLITY